MDHIMTYEEYLRDVKKGIVTDLGNSPVTPLLLMLQGKWKTQILYELCIHDTVSAVLYRCEATEVNIPYHYDDGNVHMNHVIRLKSWISTTRLFSRLRSRKPMGLVRYVGHEECLTV